MDDAPLTFLDGPEPDFVIDEDDRYSRLRLIPWWRQEKLAAAKVLVVGAGALGNEVLKNLALVGVGTTYVIDRDAIETSNLSRSVLFRASDGGRPKAQVAAERAREINPEVAFHWLKGDVINDLGLGLFADVDVVIGCLDNREARLWVNRQCWKVGTPWVDSGIQEIQGVVKVFVPPDSACYECAMTARDYQLLNLRYSCPLLSREQILEGKVPTAPTIASMMGALEVQEALKLIHGMPVDAGSALVFNGVTNQFYKTQLPRRDDCLSHETYPEPSSLEIGNSATVSTLFAEAARTLEGPLVLPSGARRGDVGDLPIVHLVGRPVSAENTGEDVRRDLSPMQGTGEAGGRQRRRGGLADGRPADGEAGGSAGDIVRVDGRATESGFFRLADSAFS